MILVAVHVQDRWRKLCASKRSVELAADIKERGLLQPIVLDKTCAILGIG
jgi:hypothetical protein